MPDKSTQAGLSDFANSQSPVPMPGLIEISAAVKISAATIALRPLANHEACFQEPCRQKK